MSLIVAARTSKPARNRVEREEAERILADRRQRGVLHAITRMNGARGIPETLAQHKRVCSLEGYREWRAGTRESSTP